jgi:hypothetical protein
MIALVLITVVDNQALTLLEILGLFFGLGGSCIASLSGLILKKYGSTTKIE